MIGADARFGNAGSARIHRTSLRVLMGSFGADHGRDVGRSTEASVCKRNFEGNNGQKKNGRRRIFPSELELASRTGDNTNVTADRLEADLELAPDIGIDDDRSVVAVAIELGESRMYVDKCDETQRENERSKKKPSACHTFDLLWISV